MTAQSHKLARRIREARQAAGLTQSDLAERSGIAVRTVQSWEAGEHSLYLHTACRLAEVLGVSLDYLAGRERTQSSSCL